MRFLKVLADHHLLLLLGHHLPLREEDLEVEEEDEDQGDEEGAQGGVHNVAWCKSRSVISVLFGIGRLSLKLPPSKDFSCPMLPDVCFLIFFDR